MEVKVGARYDVSLTAIQARVIMDSGAFPGSPLSTCCLILGGLYRFPTIDIEGIEGITHKPSQAAYRAPGASQGTFAIEAMMDLLADAARVDRLDFRLRHCIVEGDPMPNDQPSPNNGMKQVLETIGQQAIWRGRQKIPNRGVGFALGAWLGGIQPAAASVRMSPDGSLAVITGAIDLTGTNTVFRQLATVEIGVPVDTISVRTVDSDSAPFAGMSAGSKVTYTVGLAVKAAAADARRQILEIASRELEASPADLESADGKAINPILIEGQIQGGSAQGIGMGLTEELIYDTDGRLLNASLLDYRKLPSIDLPAIETVLIEVPSPFGPFGAKGVGEPPIVPGPGAIASAIGAATGCEFTQLPVTPERVVAGLTARGRAAE